MPTRATGWIYEEDAIDGGNGGLQSSGDGASGTTDAIWSRTACRVGCYLRPKPRAEARHGQSRPEYQAGFFLYVGLGFICCGTSTILTCGFRKRPHWHARRRKADRLSSTWPNFQWSAAGADKSNSPPPEKHKDDCRSSGIISRLRAATGNAPQMQRIRNARQSTSRDQAQKGIDLFGFILHRPRL